MSSTTNPIVANPNGNVTAATNPVTGITTLFSGDVTIQQDYLLAGSGIPLGIPATGTMAANGALTIGTALGLVYARIYLYFPAGAVYAASPEGFYYTEMTSTTLGTVYGNIYNPQTMEPTIPAVKTPVVDAGPGAYTGIATETTAVYATVPGGLLGTSGSVETTFLQSHTNSVGNKTCTGFFGASTFMSINATTSASLAMPLVTISNRGAEDVQVANALTYAGVTSGLHYQLAIDTSSDAVYELRLRHSTATDNIVLEYHKALMRGS